MRDTEYPIGGGVTGRVAAVMAHYKQHMPSTVEIRLHDTPLYNSIYRFDEEMIVNDHVYGVLAAFTPCLHLRRMDGSYFNTYIESYERVWASARSPAHTETEALRARIGEVPSVPPTGLRAASSRRTTARKQRKHGFPRPTRLADTAD
ncbi:hypothetical protein [Streptomyces capparidis]